jgi:ubiquitin-protein ligase E3 D
MATLTRPQAPAYDTSDILLDSSVPKPFPSAEERERILRDELLEELANEEVVLSENSAEAPKSQPEALSEAHHVDTMASMIFIQHFH